MDKKKVAKAVAKAVGKGAVRAGKATLMTSNAMPGVGRTIRKAVKGNPLEKLVTKGLKKSAAADKAAGEKQTKKMLARQAEHRRILKEGGTVKAFGIGLYDVKKP